MQNVDIFLFPHFNPRPVPLYPTDSIEDFKQRVRYLVDNEIPQSVYFHKNFPISISQLLSDKSYNSVVPLWKILRSYEKPSHLPLLFQDINKDFTIPLYNFLEDWLFIHLPSVNDDKEKSRWQVILLSIKVEWTMEYIQSFKTDLLIPNTNRKIHREDFKKLFDKDWYIQKRKSILDARESIVQDVEASDAIGQEFDAITPLPISDIEEKGQLLTLEIHDQELSTGILFERTRLLPEIPSCRYKTFFKILYQDNNIALSTDETSPDFYSLQFINKDGQNVIFIKNTAHGIWCQSIIGLQSPFKTIDDLLQFLNIDKKHISKQTSNGLFIQFHIINNPLEGVNPLEWNPLDPLIFSNLCMNHPIISRFLNINDTDKITRGNNSMFLYFFDPSSSTTDASSTDDENIFIGGLNRSISRFGDLTAIAHSEEIDGNARVVVRITRSKNQPMIQTFLSFFGRFVQIYNDMFHQQKKLFRHFIPTFHTAFVPSVGVSKIEDDFKLLEPEIFPSNVYSTVCQRKAKPKILSETALPAMKLKDSQWMSFPTKDMLSIEKVSNFKPRIYACTNKKDGYIYPGFVELNRVTDHPFGFAPCCFKEDHSAKNDSRIQKFINTNKTTGDSIDTIEPIYFMKFKYKISSEKRIEQTGQLGMIPDSLQSVLVSLLNPYGTFYRVGMPSRWSNFSVIACLEYYDAIKRRDSDKFRKPSVIRHEISTKFNLNIVRQECYDLSIDEIRSKILDLDSFFDPQRFWRLLEIYYKINLLIFAKDAKNQIRMVRPHSYGNYSYFIYPERPIVCLYQHLGGTRMLTESSLKDKDPYYELIAYEDLRDVSSLLQLDFAMDASKQEFIHALHAGYNSHYRLVPFSLSNTNLVLPQLKSQFIDSVGKVRILFYTDLHIPIFCEEQGLPPLNLPSPTTFTLKKIPFRDLLIKDLNIVRVEVFESVCSIIFRDISLFRIMFYGNVKELEQNFASVHTTNNYPNVFLRFIHYFDIPSTLPEMITFDQVQILVDVLQDYLLILLSSFIYSKEIRPRISRESVDDLLDVFFSVYIHWSNDHFPYEKFLQDISPLVKKNRFLFDNEDKLILPRNTRKRFYFFLKWFLLRNGIPEKVQHLTELPSYYQNATHFHPTYKNTIVQLTHNAVNLPQKNGSVFIKNRTIPDLFDIIKDDRIHYFYSIDATPEPIPYVVLKYSSMEFALKHIHHLQDDPSILTWQQLENIPNESSSLSYYLWEWDKSRWIRSSTSKGSSPCAIAELIGFIDEDSATLLFIPVPFLYR